MKSVLKPEKISLGLYFLILSRLLRQPRVFFSQLSPDMGLAASLGFVGLSGVLFSVARITFARPENPLLWGGIWLVNAVGMALIAAAVGFTAMVMIMGRRVTFKRFFSVYALSSGITLLVSWLPVSFWITEPWRWWLIAVGLTDGLGFGIRQAWLIIGISIVVILLFFWSLLAVRLN